MKYAFVGELVVERQRESPEIHLRDHEDFTEILVDDTAFIHRNDVIEAAAPVKPQCQRAVLVFIAEAELHLVAVGGLGGAGFDALPLVVLLHFVQKGADLVLLEAELLDVGDTLV